MEIVCTVCPVSCSLAVTILDNGEIRVEGARCPRGIEYGRQEVIQPRRVVMTVIKVRGGNTPVVPVKTSKPVPKECIEDVIKATLNIELEAPVEIGEVVVRDICGADLVATRRVEKI
ncbi:MAG: DUF1667 domain-containing protein [Desulfurococcus sp.]|nr:DUF1667 domain-containing protein [Desulfurococcus sp.]